MAKKLVFKFLTNNITDEELVTLKNWLQIPKNQEYFKKMVRANQQLDFAYRPIDVEKAFLRIKNKTSHGDKPRFLSSMRVWKYAATILVLVGISIGIYFQSKSTNNVIQDITTDGIQQITLKLEDGTIQVLDENVQTTIKNRKGDEVVSQEYDQLKYKEEDAGEKELVFNELMVPYGKRFNVELADGTFVYLNAGTKLRYPRAFTDPNKREVYLDGEALFEVKENPSHPFIVHTEKMDIRVLGTTFNVSSYKNENNTSTVLVEGSVGVYRPSEAFDAQNSIVIAPKQQAVIQSDEFTVREVNVQKHIAWTRGELYFVNDRFANIIKEMERHYDVEIENNTPELNEVRYTGTFESETIEQVLNTFKRNTKFDYHKENNKIIIRPAILY